MNKTYEKCCLDKKAKSYQQLHPLIKELRVLANGWRHMPSDPHNIANSVMITLEEVANAIVRAYGNFDENKPNKPNKTKQNEN